MACVESQSDILKKLDDVESVIAEAVQQALYRKAAVSTCFLQSYREGKFSLIFDIDAAFKWDDILPLKSWALPRTASMQFTAFVSYGDSSYMSTWTKAEQQDMLVRNIEIVKCPGGANVPSVVRLNLQHDAVPQGWTPGVYVNTVKGGFDFLQRLSDWKLRLSGELVGKVPLNGPVPCEIHSGPGVVDRIPDHQREFVQSLPEVRNFMFQALTSVWTVLDCSNAGVFERLNSGVHVRNMFLGPLSLEPSVPIRCAHGREGYSNGRG